MRARPQCEVGAQPDRKPAAVAPESEGTGGCPRDAGQRLLGGESEQRAGEVEDEEERDRRRGAGVAVRGERNRNTQADNANRVRISIADATRLKNTRSITNATQQTPEKFGGGPEIRTPKPRVGSWISSPLPYQLRLALRVQC